MVLKASNTVNLPIDISFNMRQHMRNLSHIVYTFVLEYTKHMSIHACLK
jgi:hypothetical protein